MLTWINIQVKGMAYQDLVLGTLMLTWSRGNML